MVFVSLSGNAKAAYAIRFQKVRVVWLKVREMDKVIIPRIAMETVFLRLTHRKKLIPDYEVIEGLVRTSGAAFCLSGAGPTLLCITRNKNLREILQKRLEGVTSAKWEICPLHVEFQGAHIVE